MENNEKRNLSALEYLKVLEVEWWINNLRRKIYPGKKDKTYYNTASSLKKSRIIEISERNELPHIFNTPELMKELNKRFSLNGGCPVFDKRTETDIRNYFIKTSEVRCFFGFDNDKKSIIKIGKIIDFDYEKGIVVVEIEGKTANLLMEYVTRIF